MLAPPAPVPAPPVAPLPTAGPSRALGKPFHGRLENGVQLPAEGPAFYTWDWGLHRSPNRGWRRFGTANTVTTTLRVLVEFHAQNPTAPRIGVADLSRPHGGPFGKRFGGDGHASHQNGLDVDIPYPRLDRVEKPPIRPAQIDRTLAQELLDRFIAAGAQYVFVGYHAGLHGPRKVVQAIPDHDDLMHVRFRP